MPTYVLSPYVHELESHLDPARVRRAVFHQLTGVVFEPDATVWNLLAKARLEPVELDPSQLQQRTSFGQTVLQLIASRFLIEDGVNAFDPFLDHYIIRPLQNPAVTYRSSAGELVLVRMEMLNRVCSPTREESQEVFEEILSPPYDALLQGADGKSTVRQMFDEARMEIEIGRQAVEFLSSPSTQLIKLSPEFSDWDDPNKPFNSVPRSLYHSAQWKASDSLTESSVAEFHTKGIEDADWEFDIIEPTVNHAFRFPSEVFGGLSYGARFCSVTLTPEFLRIPSNSTLDILEVGGGTGRFACSFLEHARESAKAKLKYHIVELSPALAAHQKKLLNEQGLQVEHFFQDAVKFDIPEKKFDLIIANEVIADLPVSSVWRTKTESSRRDSRWEGEGAVYIERYNLALDNAPDQFRVNSGVFEFIERCWKHLRPGGTVILTEYGADNILPLQILHLNHEEFSIHFGHVKTCAESTGFDVRLISLVDFLRMDDQARVLAGNEQHIICLNHVLNRFGLSVPFAAITESDYEHVKAKVAHIELMGPRFTAVANGYYFGPPVAEFKAVVLMKPQTV